MLWGTLFDRVQNLFCSNHIIERDVKKYNKTFYIFYAVIEVLNSFCICHKLELINFWQQVGLATEFANFTQTLQHCPLIYFHANTLIRKNLLPQSCDLYNIIFIDIFSLLKLFVKDFYCKTLDFHLYDLFFTLF